MSTVGADGLVREEGFRTGEIVQVAGLAAATSDATALEAPAGRQFMTAADAEEAGLVTASDTDTGRVVWLPHEAAGTLASICPDGTA